MLLLLFQTAASGSVSVAATGVSTTASQGDVTVVAKATADLAGVAATGGVGSPTVTLLLTASLTGVAGTASQGDVSVVAKAVVEITGVTATGGVGLANGFAAQSETVVLDGFGLTGSPGTVSILNDRRQIRTRTRGGPALVSRILGRRAS